LIIKLMQTNANYCVCQDNIAVDVVRDILSYTGTIMEYNVGAGRKIPKKVTLSFLNKRSKPPRFPYGLMSYVHSKITEGGNVLDLTYLDVMPLKRKLIPSLRGITFEPYQSQILRKIANYKRGILVASTGAGKTVIIGGIIDKFYIPKTVVIVINRTIFNQTYEGLCRWFPDVSVGKVGDGINCPGHITVAMYQSLKNYKPDGLEMVIVDEVHRINDSIIDFLKDIPKTHYRFGLTATPQKVENNFVKSMQMMGYIGPIIGELTDKQVEKRVVPVEVKLIRFLCGKTKGDDYQSVLRNDILYSKVRNYKLLKAAKSEALDKGKTVLVLLDETKQGEIMYKIAKEMNLNPYMVHSKMDKKQIDNIKDRLNKREIPLVIATQVFGTGTDIPEVDCVVLASARKNEIDTMQKIGRGRRRTEKKDKLILIDSIDKIIAKKFNKYFYNYSLERISIYQEKGWQITKLNI
jgi:superfamily II DNA or RNA helicase